jgi:hypothetical protein
MPTLAIAARVSQPTAHARSAYWAMHLLAGVLLVPLSLSVLLIGVLVAATSPRGLLRYRWVLVKLIATCAAVLLSLPAMTGSPARTPPSTRWPPRGTPAPGSSSPARCRSRCTCP